jgi:hypothetical protein
MIGIGKGEIKLIQFAPKSSPETCFQEVGKDIDGLLDLLEQRLVEQINIV